MKNVTLRQSQQEDLLFLYEVSTLALQSLIEALCSTQETLEEFKETFVPEKVQVIQYGGEDVGRLRVVRSEEVIDICGIQILPAFQRKGIGTKIFEGLIREAEKLRIPLMLEVHEVNASARSFYAKFGFIQIDEIKDKSKLILQYTPHEGDQLI